MYFSWRNHFFNNSIDLCRVFPAEDIFFFRNIELIHPENQEFSRVKKDSCTTVGKIHIQRGKDSSSGRHYVFVHLVNYLHSLKHSIYIFYIGNEIDIYLRSRYILSKFHWDWKCGFAVYLNYNLIALILWILRVIF